MDERLRKLERQRYEAPEMWLRGLIRAGKLGPVNLAILGMLGYEPAVNILGGRSKPKYGVYWYRRWWPQYELERHTGSRWLPGHYNRHIDRLYYHISLVPWIKEIPKKDLSQHAHREHLLNEMLRRI